MSVARKRKVREIIVISSDEDEQESRNAPKRQRSNPGRNPSSWAPSNAPEPPVDTMATREHTLTERHLCLAVCSTCGQHLQRLNSKLHFCQSCRTPYPRWTHPCGCHQYRLEEPEVPTEPQAISDELRAAVEASGLSKMAQRVLFLVSQVPVGQYTTFTAIKDWFGGHNHMVPPKPHIRSALRRNIFTPDVPDHRVVASNGGFGLFNWGDHGEGWEIRRQMLAEEGVRFGSDGRLLGSAFRGFR